MRTNSLLLTAALGLVGVAGVSAQSVYSVNAVGYVNKSILPGYNLIANPLNGTNNQVSTVLPAAALPDDTECLTWNSVLQDFNQAIFVAGGAWFDQLGNPAVTVLAPGRGIFLRNTTPSSFVVTFVGEVPQGVVNNTVGANYDFVSSVVPQSAGLSTLGFPGVPDMLYQTFNSSIQDYDQAIQFIGVQPGYPSGWADSLGNPIDPTPGVAQGFLITNPPGSPAVAWNRTFSVN